ncbi:MAG: preprotein translocase subunit SecA [Candidatus Paceibacterota bacterium]
MFEKILGTYSERTLKQYWPVIERINRLESTLTALTDTELKAKTAEFKERLTRGETLDELLPEAFAVCREAAKRTLDQRHFDVQLLGGIVLHHGNIAEMKTGEGKTLVATLPTYLNALSGKGVHVVTVNDYLSRRDAVWMGQIYSFLGLSVGIINHQTSFLYADRRTEADVKRDAEGAFNVFPEFLRPVSRHEAYLADITYGTNNEFGFDYLRDNLAYTADGLAGRSDDDRYHFAIVDEVDSILIDESRTPLIISAPVAGAAGLYQTFTKIAAKLESGKHYTVDEKLKAVSLNDDGISRAEELLGVSNIYTEKGIKYVHHLETALRAKALFERDKHYVVRDGEAIIVDEFTGRLQPGRRWSEGLHQAIEAKEGVAIKDESRTFATVTYQNYFRLYHKLSGMTGTALTSREEFQKVYGLDTLAIPTNQPNQRLDLPDQVFQTEHGKFLAIARRVKELQKTGQPVLIGTVSIEKNERLSEYLKRSGVAHEILNAKNHEREGQIIAAAGRRGSVVVATNMAGRGVDIKLGGPVPSPEVYQAVKDLGGLFVIGTERHEARRIDNQLRGRTARQGDPGTTQFFLSLEDSLMRIFASDRIKNMMGRFGIAEDEPIENRLITKSIENAQSKIEGLNFDARKHLLEYDDVINHQRLVMYDRRRKILLGEVGEVKEFLTQAMTVLAYSSADQESWWADYDEKMKTAPEAYIANVRRAILQVIDMLWVEHIEGIDYVKNSVRLRAYGQRDPLVEFKREGLHLFKDLELSIFEQCLKTVANIGAEAIKVEAAKLETIHQSGSSFGGSGLPAGATGAAAGVAGSIAGGGAPPAAPAPTFPKVGRNEPCPCGSGKKFKKCHGQ